MLGQFIAAEHNVLGVIGVVFVLLAYFLLQLGRLASTNLIYPLMNFVGSILILISLYFMPNLPSVIIEIAWLLISAIGLMRCARYRDRG